MGMNSNAYAYEQAQSYERRRMEVLDGKQAKVREDAKRADIVKIVVGVSAIFIYLLGVTFMSAKIYSAGVEINSLQSQIAETEEMIARAELEISELASLERIETYALENLGMVYPASDDIYFLDEQSSLRIAQGQQELAIAASAEEEAVAEEQSLWQSIVDGFTSFLTGTANAAEN